jgi:hypothetical protein
MLLSGIVGQHIGMAVVTPGIQGNHIGMEAMVTPSVAPKKQ